MPHLAFHLHCPLHDSFRVRQVAGMFDLPLRPSLEERFSVEVPDESEDWRIGAIVGPSGSGKTAVARAAFGEHLHRPADWPASRAVIDCFGDLPIKRITRALTSVGLGSPPAWLKPFAVLSNGERFRCELARALLRTSEQTRGRSSSLSPVHRGEGRGEGTDARFAGCASVHEELSAAKPPACAEAHPTKNPPLTLTLSPEYRGEGTRTAAKPDSSRALVAFDEFTSFVDRTVARISSAAVARAIRSGTFDVRFVAVTCHEDILPWLSPDWVLDMASGQLSRGGRARPPIHLKIRKAQRDEWNLFRRHHYLSGALHGSAQCFIAQFDGAPAAFCAALAFPHPRRPGWREHRTVCLPDFQGVGIGHALAEFVASLYVATGKPYFSRSSHPAILRHRARSPVWRMIRNPSLVRPVGTSGQGRTGMSDTVSALRLTAGFEFVGLPRYEEARRLGVL